GAEADGEGGDEEVVLEGSLVCALTGQQREATPQEETLQSFIEQLHREYGIDLEDMERDVRIECESDEGSRVRKRSRTVQLVVYQPGQKHEPGNIIRVVVVAKPGTKGDPKAIDALDEVLGSLSSDHVRVFGVWTNGLELAFRMREYDERIGHPDF